jgi:hypothetical protein
MMMECVTSVYRETSKVNEDIIGFMESQRSSLEEYQEYSRLELLAFKYCL